jgi:hypothetical protein
MSERYKPDGRTKRDELLDGPQPGFRRLTEDHEKELEAEDKARLDHMAENLGGDEERDDIGPHIVVGQD